MSQLLAYARGAVPELSSVQRRWCDFAYGFGDR